MVCKLVIFVCLIIYIAWISLDDLDYPFTSVCSPTAATSSSNTFSRLSVEKKHPNYQSIQSSKEEVTPARPCVPMTLSFSTKSLPFERHIYEALLTTLHEVTVLEYISIKQRMDLVFDITGLKYFISGDTEYPPTQIFPPKIQKEMAGLRFQLESLQRKLTSYKNCLLDDVLAEELSMAYMNLSYLSESSKNYVLVVQCF